MATISATTTFDLSLTPKQFKWADTTDWAGQSILTANVNGCFKVTAPSNIVIYDNTFNVSRFSNVNADIYIDNSLDSQQTVSLPIGIDGLVEPGTYTILYMVYNSDTEEYYSQSYTYSFSYTTPVVDIILTADCVSPLFTSKDNTNYAQSGATLDLTRVQTINYPFGSAGEGSPVVSSLQTVTTSTFYNGTQTTEIESDLVYTFTDGLIVIDSVSGSKEIQVDCTYICNLTCCVNTLENTMNSYKTTNQVLYQEYKQKFDLVMAYIGLIEINIKCGLNNNINTYLDRINTISNCNNDCSCSDDPSLVVGLGFSDISVTVVSDSSPTLTVTPVIVGDTTEYHIALSDAFIALVEASTNTDLVAGNNITLSSSTAGNTTTYTINGLSTVVAAGTEVTVTPSGPTAGVTTYTINGKSTVVAAGNGVTVTPSGPTAGVTTYTVAISGNGESTASAQTLDQAAYTDVTGATFSALTAGNYLVWFSCLVDTADVSTFTFRLYKDGVAADLEYLYNVTAGTALSPITVNIQAKLSSVTSAFNVKYKMTGTAGAVQNQSFQYLKIG